MEGVAAVPGVPAGQHLPRISSTFRGAPEDTTETPRRSAAPSRPAQSFAWWRLQPDPPPRLPAPRPRGYLRAAPPPPRSRVQQSGPRPPLPPPSLLLGFCRPAVRPRETRSCRDNGRSGAVASGECAADGGGAWDRDRERAARVPAGIAGGLPSRGRSGGSER